MISKGLSLQLNLKIFLFHYLGLMEIENIQNDDCVINVFGYMINYVDMAVIRIEYYSGMLLLAYFDYH